MSKKLDVTKIEIGRIELTPLGNRKFVITHSIDIEVKCEDDKYRYVHMFRIHPDFVTDFRSGGIYVDKFIDQFGESPEIQAAYLVHDLCYTPSEQYGGMHVMSKDEADELLRAMLVKAGISKWKARLVKIAVQLFGKSAYRNDDENTHSNSVKFVYQLSDSRK